MNNESTINVSIYHAPSNMIGAASFKDDLATFVSDTFHRYDKIAEIKIPSNQNTSKILEEAYHLTNSIDSAWFTGDQVELCNTGQQYRSSSIGDVFEIDGKKHIIASAGFIPFKKPLNKSLKVWSSLIEENLIGTEDDNDQLFYHMGASQDDTVAEFSIFVPARNRDIDVVVKIRGTQDVKVNLAINENGKLTKSLLPCDTSLPFSEEAIKYDYKLMKQAIDLETASGLSYITRKDECYLDMIIIEDGKQIGNWYDTFGEAFGSIQECFDAVTAEDIQALFENTTEKELLINRDQEEQESDSNDNGFSLAR